MCGRYGQISGEKEIKDRFDVENFEGKIVKNYNLAPTQSAPIIEKHSPNSLRILNWGFQPSWSTKILINAQAEKLSQSHVWKKAFLESRCIVPANYFFEWKKLDNRKVPYLIKLKEDKIMGFAGLVLNYKDNEGKDQEGFVIITTKPNALMEKIHNRMPAILRPEDEDKWLNPDNADQDLLTNLLTPIQSDEMIDYKVDLAVNSPRNNNKNIIQPIKKLI